MTILQLLKLLIPELSDTMATVSLYAAIVMALVTCFFGYRLRKVWYTLLVFGVGALLGFWACRLFMPDRLWLCVGIGLGVGLIVSLFTYRLYQAVAFVIAFFAVFGAVGEALGDIRPILSLIAALVLGVLAGILAARFKYAVVIILTSVSGGWRAASLLRRCIPALKTEPMLIIAGVIIIAGLLFQFIGAKKENKAAKKE